MLRKVTVFPVFLSLLIIAGSGMYYSLFFMQKKEHRKFLLESVPKSPELISIFKVTPQTSSDFHFVDEGKEVWYKDQIYDVIRTSRLSDGTSVLYVVLDKRENHLFKKLTLINNTERKPGSDQNCKVPDLFKYLLISRESIAAAWIVIAPANHSEKAPLLASPYAYIPDIPPELIS